MKLYHGTDKKLTTIDPIGINMGTRIQSPRWSSYWWDDEASAIRWAVYQSIRRLKKVKTYYHLPTGKFIYDTKDFGLVRKISVGIRAFVYQTDIPRHRVGIGSSPDIEEYTIDESVTPTTETIITITGSILAECSMPMSGVNIQRYIADLKSGKYRGGRSILVRWLLDPNKDGQRHEYLGRIKSGELQPGDPLD